MNHVAGTQSEHIPHTNELPAHQFLNPHVKMFVYVLFTHRKLVLLTV